MGKPQPDVVGLSSLGIKPAKVVDPAPGVFGVASGKLGRRAVKIEAGHPGTRDRAALVDERVSDDRRLARRPEHLLDRPVLVEPHARRQDHRLAGLVVDYRSTGGIG